MAGQRASIQIGVAQVLRRAGVQHPLQRTVQLDELRVGDAVVEAATPIDLDLVLEATGNAVIASGVVRTVASCQCRRCLERFDQPVDAPVREIFEPRPTEGETYPLTAEHIDVVPLVRDAILLALPLAPLCRADCPGPAPEAFPALSGDAAGAADAAGEVAESAAAGDAAAAEPDQDDAGPPPRRDPRWAALDQLRLDR